jgi:hypothetical protein
MPPNVTEEEQNRALAAYTDALLRGERLEQEERPALANTVELLARTLGPQPVPDTLQRRLRRTIQDRWAEPRPSLRGRLALFRSLTGRWAWAAAGILMVLALAAAFALPTDGESVVGTVTGDAGPVLLAAVVVLAVALGMVWLFGRRKR